MAGRPTKLTPALQATITDAIKIGATYQAAAEFAGIAYDTFNEWLKGSLPRHRAFSEAVRQANAQARIALLAKINAADDWRSKAWILERRFPEEYGQTLKYTRMTDDELRAHIAAQLTELGPGISGGETPRPDSDAAGADDGRPPAGDP